MSPISQVPRLVPIMDGANSPLVKCVACENHHPTGQCPLKAAGVEYCPLCGIAHYGRGRTCPHINSVTQLQAMHEAIKLSPESVELKELAKKKVTGLIGSIRQKRRFGEEARATKDSQALRQSGQPGQGSIPNQHAAMNRQAVPRLTNGGGSGKENRVVGLHAPMMP